nr:MAG TPA: head closure knob [Caudoviricetes sp.]
MTRSQYRKMLNLNGPTQRDRIINKSVHDQNKLAPVSPSYKDVTIDDVPRKLNIISSTVMNQKIIHTLPGEDFAIGSIVYWSKSHWLITERDAEDEITVRGRIQICQKQITWQDDNTYEIRFLWATVEKPYYSNLEENKTMSYSTREFRIQMPFDEYSANLNIGKRLMLEIVNGVPKTYRITSIDQMTSRIDYNGEQVGFLSFNVEQDLYNPDTDNAEKMICDYVPIDDTEEEPPEIVYPPVEDTASEYKLSIDFTGAPTVQTGGFGKLFTAKIDDEVCEEANWTLTGEHVPDKIHFKNAADTVSNPKCKVVCIDDPKLIGTVVTLKVQVQKLTANVELEVI